MSASPHAAITRHRLLEVEFGCDANDREASARWPPRRNPKRPAHRISAHITSPTVRFSAVPPPAGNPICPEFCPSPTIARTDHRLHSAAGCCGRRRCVARAGPDCAAVDIFALFSSKHRIDDDDDEISSVESTSGRHNGLWGGMFQRKPLRPLNRDSCVPRKVGPSPDRYTIDRCIGKLHVPSFEQQACRPEVPTLAEAVTPRTG